MADLISDWNGGPVSPHVFGLVARNGGPYTLGGTNTWIISFPHSRSAIIVDPGPTDAVHCDRVVEELTAQGLHPTAIILTHGHDDHSDLAPALHQRTGAPVLARDQRFCIGSNPLNGSEVFGTREAHARVLLTPGHTSDSISLLVLPDGVVLTGDTFLGGTSTMIDYPDGDMESYLNSLNLLIDIADEHDCSWLLPGHGSPTGVPAQSLRQYQEHRYSRINEVAAEIAKGRYDNDTIVDAIYPGVPEVLRSAAVQNVAAARVYLAATMLREDGPPARTHRRHRDNN